MNIYDILLHGQPQSLQDLWDYQQRHYDCGIEKPNDGSRDITFSMQPESLDEIDYLMRKPPSRSRD